MRGPNSREGGVSRERLLFFGYLLLQEYVVVGLETQRFVDSRSYLHLSLIGSARRLPTVPLLYKVFPTDGTRIAAQVVVAAIAWWVLARTASRLVIDRRVQIGVRSVLLMLGLVGPVTNWNSTILSESVAVSLTALLIAAWISYVQQPRWPTVSTALAVTLLWTLARQPNVLFGLGIALAGVLAFAVGRMRLGLRAVAAVGLVAISVIGLLEIHRNEALARRAVGDIVQMRILSNPQWTSWFVAHGMPYSSAIDAKYSGEEFSDTQESTTKFGSWVLSDGYSTYIHFVVTHPGYTLLGPLPYFSGEQASDHYFNTSIYAPMLQPNPKPSILSPAVNYGRHREVLPLPVQTLLFAQGQIGDVLALAVGAIGLAVATVRRFGWDARFVVPAVATGLVVPEGYILWLSGGETTGEFDRLSIVTAVSVRIALWVMLAVAIDRMLVNRRAERSAGAQT